MSTPPRRIAPPGRLASLARRWPWFILGFAAFFFAALFAPKLFFSEMYTETIVLPIFYQDVVQMHHSIANWGWGGFSALFPDITVFFLLNFLCRDGELASELLIGLFFISWIASSCALAVALKRPNLLSLCSLFVLLWVGLMCDFGLPSNWSLGLRNPLFQPIYHSGTGLLCLTCLALLFGQIGRDCTAGFWWLFVLIFLGGISDLLFLVVFVAPALATLALLAVTYRRDWKRHLALGLNLGLAGVAAYFLGPYCFPARMGTDVYVHVNLDLAKEGYRNLVGQFSGSEHHLFVFMIVLDALTVLGGIAGLLFFLFSPGRKYVTPLAVSAMAYCSSAVFLNWLATIVTGDYQDIPANRYVTVALLIPMFLAVFGLHAIILWRPWLEKIFAVAISAFAISVAFIPQDRSFNYCATIADIPFLESVEKQYHIDACLSDYWSANIVTFLSHGTVCPRSLTNDGKIYYWFNNLEWFGKGHPVEEWPHFRMIYEPDHGYSDKFGPPDQILYSPNHSEIWLYSDARSIRYNEYFDVLSNNLPDDGRTVRLYPADMPGDTGRIQNHSKFVVEGQDQGGWIEFGPYLVLKPGHYRATFRYAYSAPLPKDNLPTYDLLVHTGNREQSFDDTTLPCPDTDPQAFTDDFTVTEPGHKYEMRLYYHGSGSLRVDALDLTYKGP